MCAVMVLLGAWWNRQPAPQMDAAPCFGFFNNALTVPAPHKHTPHRTMDRLAALNVVGVGAIAALACVAAGLGVHSLLAGSAHAIPMLPQWQQLGPTPAAQLRALASVVPVIIAAMVAHQVCVCVCCVFVCLRGVFLGGQRQQCGLLASRWHSQTA